MTAWRTAIQPTYFPFHTAMSTRNKLVAFEPLYVLHLFVTVGSITLTKANRCIDVSI